MPHPVIRIALVLRLRELEEGMSKMTVLVARAVAMQALAVALICVGFGPTAAAAPLKLADLAPGSTYRIAFVTSQASINTSTSIAFYDAFVNSIANGSGSILASYGTTWRVIGSTSAVDAYDHIGGNFLDPIYTPAGDLVAHNAADLWDGWLLNPINQFESGILGSVYVSTGTGPDGRRIWALGGDNPYGAVTPGAAGAISEAWIVAGFEGNSGLRPKYGISDTLVVPGGTTVPEPSTWPLLTAGVVGLLARRRLCGRA
jgi:hypothetical protein